MTTESGTGTTQDEKKREIRRAYRKKREAQIQELAARIDHWEAKAKKASADARIRVEDEIEELRAKLDTARVKLSLLQDASESAWEDVKSGLETAVGDLQRAFRKASSRFE